MSASDILSEMLSNMDDSYQKTIGFPTYDLLAAVSLHMAGTDGEIEAAKRLLDPENLSGSDLDRYIYPRSGLERKAATFAHGELTVTGTGTIARGTIFESSGGIQFAATETVAVAENGTVPVSCRTDGAAGNLPAHSVTQMPVTVQGITSCDNPEPMGGGYAGETDAEYYARYLVKIRTPATSGNVYHYMTWALEVSDVGHAKVFPRVQGLNTVDVVLADSSGQPASSALVKSVQDYIDPDSEGAGRGQAPIGAQCFVTAASEKKISVSARVSKLDTADGEALTAAIKAAIAEYLAGTVFQQDYVSCARIGAAILGTDGVLDFENLLVDGGTANVSIGERECPVPGEVTITYA